MVVIKNTYISPLQPTVREGIWLKPVDGGFVAYVIDGGLVKPLKLVNDNGTATTSDDSVAKYDAYGAAAAVLGTDTDSSTDMTLYGLKAYIDAEIESLG